jgi:hypothetical protein
MKQIRPASIAATAAALALVASARTPGQGPGIGDYQLVSDVRVTRTVNELTYRAVLTNGGQALAGATATVTSIAAATTIVDGVLTFGPVGPGGTVVSTDTFSFRHNRLTPFAWSNVQWSITAIPANRPPTANAGPDQTVAVGTRVSLDGSGSSDPDGNALTYSWTLQSTPAGSAAMVSPPAAVAPTFVADAAGEYSLQLVVNDGVLGSTPDTVLVRANSPPVPNAGPDLTGNVGEDLSLAGTLSSDPDGDPVTYSWSVQSGPGGGAAIADATGSTATFRATAAGTYVVALSVSDPFGSAAIDTATVIIREITPPPTSMPEIWVDDVSVSEDETDGTNLVFTITQSALSTLVTRFSFATADGSATSPEDFTAVSGTAEIPPGSTTTEISVPIKGDTLAELDETLRLELSNPVNATIADAEGTGEIVDDDPGPPTTVELIDRALADGAIDAETALLYKVLAEFQDSRLPAQYLGRDERFFEGIAIRDAARRFATLTPSTQEILAPFLEFPDLFALPLGIPQQAAEEQDSEPEQRGPSALQAQPSYAVIEFVPGTVRMGWDVNSPQAFMLEQVATALKAEFDARIWPKLRIFLGAPVAGNRILIRLSDTPGASWEETADCTTAKIFLNRDGLDGVVLAHELTHALLDLNFSIAACNDAEKMWMHEATATWAQHYVYPPANSGREQGAATYFLRDPERSLSVYDKSPRGHEYGAYLWFLRLAGQASNPGVVRAVWEAAAGATSLEAIESVLRSSGFGGFEEQWPKFALDNWNRERPYRKYYEWDRLDHKASQHEFHANLNGAGWQSVQLGYDLPILSADYQRWVFTGDPSIRGILFKNTDAGNTPTAGVHAIVKIKDQPWRSAEDWSQEKEKSFCRDNEGEDVEEVILVITNRGFRSGDPNTQDKGNHTLTYTALPCSDWTGSTTYRKESTASGAVEVVTVSGENLTFRVDLAQNMAVWRAIAGTVTVHTSATSPFEDGTCTATASRVFDANGRAQFTLLPGGPNDPALRFSGQDLALPYTPPTIPVTLSCSSSSGSFTVVNDHPFFGFP